MRSNPLSTPGLVPVIWNAMPAARASLFPAGTWREPTAHVCPYARVWRRLEAQGMQVLIVVAGTPDQWCSPNRTGDDVDSSAQAAFLSELSGAFGPQYRIASRLFDPPDLVAVEAAVAAANASAQYTWGERTALDLMRSFTAQVTGLGRANALRRTLLPAADMVVHTRFDVKFARPVVVPELPLRDGTVYAEHRRHEGGPLWKDFTLVLSERCLDGLAAFAQSRPLRLLQRDDVFKRCNGFCTEEQLGLQLKAMGCQFGNLSAHAVLDESKRLHCRSGTHDKSPA